MPQPPLPKKEDQTDIEYAKIQTKYKSERAAWKLGEIAARNIIMDRLSDSACPYSYEKYIVKQFYDCVARTREETTTALYPHTLERFLSTKFDSSVDDYYDRFFANYQSVNSAADLLSNDKFNLDMTQYEYTILPGQAAAMFLLGTNGFSWLDSWRDTTALESDNKLASLESMMSSLRVFTGNRLQVRSKVFAVTIVGGVDLDEMCERCKNKHLNKQRFKQYPNWCRKRVMKKLNLEKKVKPEKGLARALTYEKDNEDSSNSEGVAVGTMSLTHQGTAVIKVGELNFEFRDMLYSPNSTCSIISAGRLQSIDRATACLENGLLI